MSILFSGSIKKTACLLAGFGLLAAVFVVKADAQRPASTNGKRPALSQNTDEEKSQRPDRGFLKAPTKRDAARFIENRPYNAGGEEFRTINGTFNNPAHPRFGSIFIELERIAPAAYGPNNSLARQDMPSARVISNAVNYQPSSAVNNRGLSDYIWQWGQFTDHDIDLTQFNLPSESENIIIPLGDAVFDPFNLGDRTIQFRRSLYVPRIFRSASLVREQLNEITAWNDGSNVYGSDQETASDLRSFVNGKLRTSDGGEFGDFLPISDDDGQFEAGDIRAGEQSALTCMHTLFMREHNRLADEILANTPNLTDEEIYQRARKKVYSIMESITYNEFLPALLGPNNLLEPYQGYDPTVNPNIANGFSAAAFRYGHTELNNQLLRLNDNGTQIIEGHVLLRHAFFNPDIIQEAGIDPIIKGLMSQAAQAVDTQVISAVRNFLFEGLPGSPQGFDLAALNIQRGRDHGLPDFNTFRVAYGLAAVNSFAEITSDPLVQAKLASVYPSVNDMDPWIGILAEDHADESSLGATAIASVKSQFERIRDGDRFWYELVFAGEELEEIRNTTLADVILRNTELTNVQDNVFFIE